MPTLTPGKTIRIDEFDYAYGLGPLTLRVSSVSPHQDPAWVRVTGVEIRWTGREGPLRDVLVRAGAQVVEVSSARDEGPSRHEA
ncbi:hypothetical protein [Pilimelia columellifera]|uniref:Uncharacterized protein n=1 Tax=Pilimelia columellifera subsp. columellifera TaxID=706583 RepID=A0ABP6A7H0_9ACTN